MMELNKIYQGDCLEVLKTLPSESINCCMTSPPYWALRDYGVEGQLGLEPTFQEYIKKLCDIFDEVKRVLRKDGTLWVNIGDTYNAGGNYRGKEIDKSCKEVYSRKDFDGCKNDKKAQGIEAKSLCNIPARFSIEMQNRGWILRNVIIWHKPNCMPSSVKDRFTVDFEYLYFFVKSKKYFFETQYEPFKSKPTEQGARNKRTVWSIPTKPFKEAHFATYPESLCETPIKAGCPEFVCNKCRKPREKILKSKGTGIDYSNKSNYEREISIEDGQGNFNRNSYKKLNAEYEFLGLSDCGCNAGFSGGIVLDPFFGAGTTGLVAVKQNKNFIGIELSPKYCKIAEKRLNEAEKILREVLE